MRGIKNRGNNKWKHLGVFLALLLVFGFLSNSVRNVYQKKKAAEQILTRMEKEAADLKEREKNLNDLLAKLETKEGLDFEIRQKLNVAGAGESVAIIVDEKSTVSAQPTPTFLWQKLKDFFVNLFK